jgi:hypothetical protein
MVCGAVRSAGGFAPRPIQGRLGEPQIRVHGGHCRALRSRGATPLLSVAATSIRAYLRAVNSMIASAIARTLSSDPSTSPAISRPCPPQGNSTVRPGTERWRSGSWYS